MSSLPNSPSSEGPRPVPRAGGVEGEGAGLLRGVGSHVSTSAYHLPPLLSQTWTLIHSLFSALSQAMSDSRLMLMLHFTQSGAWSRGFLAIRPSTNTFSIIFLQMKRSPPRGHSIWCRGEGFLLTTENILKRSVSLYTRVWDKQYLIPYIDA